MWYQLPIYSAWLESDNAHSNKKWGTMTNTEYCKIVISIQCGASHQTYWTDHFTCLKANCPKMLMYGVHSIQRGSKQIMEYTKEEIMLNHTLKHEN